jgi:subtilase family serine protease
MPCLAIIGLGAALVATSAGAANLRASVDLGRAAAAEEVTFDVTLPSRDPDGLEALLAALQDPASPRFHHWLTPEERARRFGPDPASVAAVMRELTASGLQATATENGVRATGSAGSVERLLSLELHHAQNRLRQNRIVAEAVPHLPPATAAAGGRIATFDPLIRQHALARPANDQSTTGPYWAFDLREAYSAVSAQYGQGGKRTIAILMDADFLDSDIVTYFGDEYATVPAITRIRVDGGAGFDAKGDSVEATLDIEQAAGMANRSAIRLYIIKDLSDQSIMDGLNQILADNVADIVSMSFGGCEASYTAADNGGTDYSYVLDQYHTIFSNGNTQGITFVASSGDNGALQCPPAGYFNGQAGPFTYGPGANSPATDPAVTAVGGTNLVTTYTDGSDDSSYVSENANDDLIGPDDPYGLGQQVSGGVWGSGGGPSIHFAAPSWQSLVSTGTTWRATPDISMQMGGCPDGTISSCAGKNRSAIVTAFNGSLIAEVGTSAAAPCFAGVLALQEHLSNKNERLGNINFATYNVAAYQATHGTLFFHQRIQGYNGAYSSYKNASAPYNMVIGNGSLYINNYIGAFTDPVSGPPFSPSNP